MQIALKIVAALLAIMAGAWSYSFFNAHFYVVIALIGAIAVGVLVYYVLVHIFTDVNRTV